LSCRQKEGKGGRLSRRTWSQAESNRHLNLAKVAFSH
jgi:hypothetical protein